LTSDLDAGQLVDVPAKQGYMSIAEDLAARIMSGEYPPGTELPTYPDLRELYGVSVTTLQKAILVLKQRGLVESVPGVRLFVADELPPAAR
jgi:GntR family transcriptional regulator